MPEHRILPEEFRAHASECRSSPPEPEGLPPRLPHTQQVTQDPMPQIKWIEVRGVCRLVRLVQQRFPNLSHVLGHGGRCGISIVRHLLRGGCWPQFHPAI